MDFIRRLFNYLQRKQIDDNGLVSFWPEQELQEEEHGPKIVTVHTDEDGMIVITIFTIEEFEMLKDIVELTQNDPYQIIKDVAEDSGITTIRFDPRQY